MDTGVDLEKRVSILEVEMVWASGTIQDIKKDLEIVKNSQFQLLDRISTLQAHTDDRFISVHKAISDQTRWVLTVILAAATLASVIQPLMAKWIN